MTLNEWWTREESVRDIRRKISDTDCIETQKHLRRVIKHIRSFDPEFPQKEYL